MLQSQAAAGLLTTAEPEMVNGGAVADTPVSVFPDAGEEGVAVGGGRDDLTVFFSIGVAVDVLLVAAFLVWAVRQWRKTGK